MSHLKCSSIIALAFLFSPVFAQSKPQTPHPALRPAASNYFRELRETYAKQQPGIIGWDSDDQRKKVIDLFDKKNPVPFLEPARTWLKKCPVDADMHFRLGLLLDQTGEFDEAIHHRFMFYGLLSSIADSGDGRSPKTAFKVISVGEEYMYLRYIGAQPGKQSLQGNCDVMEVTIEGKPQTIYFDISVHLAGLQKAFSDVAK